MPDAGAAEFDLFIEDVQVARASSTVSLDDGQQRQLASAMAASEVDLKLQFPEGEDEAELYFCDLGHDYVTVNSEYTT